MNVKAIIKSVTPPCVISAAKFLRNRKFYGVYGKFSTWEEARCKSDNYTMGGGYSSLSVIETVRKATAAVRLGNAEFERDGVLFYEKDYNFQFLAAFFYVLACEKKDSISVLDFGGALGSSYFQNRSLFSGCVPKIEWNIIEQKEFVDIGKKEVPEIAFFHTLDAFCSEKQTCDVLLLSSVLQYIPEPHSLLENLLSLKAKWIIIDRTYFNSAEEERIALQRVPPSIYDALYPIRLLPEKATVETICRHGYTPLYDWNAFDSMPLKTKFGSIRLPCKGYLFNYEEKLDNENH